MEALKDLIMKTKLTVLLIVSAIIGALVTFRKSLNGEAEKEELARQEELVRKAADEKLAAETAAIEAAKQAELEKLEAEKASLLKATAAKASEESKKLKKLAKEDKAEFKKKIEKKLGVKEKPKGRRK
jgi:hypothetical protein